MSKADDVAEAVTNPANFSELELNFKLYTKQRQFLKSFGNTLEAWCKDHQASRLCFLSANSGGKTRYCLVSAILWLLNIMPKARITVTSGSWRQLEDQAVPSLQKFQSKYPQWKWTQDKITTPQGGFCRFYSTNDPGRAEGEHAGEWDEPLVCFVDEAKSVPIWLKETLLTRVRPTVLVLMSSHGFSEGWLFEAWTKEKDLYTCILQKATECPHITKAEIDAVRKEWASFPSKAAAALGEGFVELTEDGVINAIALQACMDDPPVYDEENNEVHCFVDPSWSNDGDETVVALRRSNEVTLEKTGHPDTLEKLTTMLICEFDRLKLKAHQISVDSAGGGSLVCDRLDELGWRVKRVNNGSTPAQDQTYANAGAEMWYEFSKAATAKELILPVDTELYGQLLNRKRKAAAKGKLAVESKKEMKARGVSSPDRADAIIGACAPVGGYSAVKGFSPKTVYVPSSAPVNSFLTFGV